MYATLQSHDKKAIRALVREVLKGKGHTISVYDGESWAVKKSRTVRDILAAAGETDCDLFRVRDASGAVIGQFNLIYGNGPEETIYDYTDNEYCNAVVNKIVKL